MSSLHRRQRAVTLVELMVSTALVAVTSGLLLGILIHTRREIVRGQGIQAAQSQAQAVAKEIEALLGGAVNPAALDLPAGGLERPAEFTSTTCALLTRDRLETGEVEWAVLDASEGLRIAYAPAVARGNASPQPFVREPGLGDPRFRTTARFQYASAGDSADPDSPLLDRLAPGDYPQLVRVTITVEDREENGPSCELATIAPTL